MSQGKLYSTPGKRRELEKKIHRGLLEARTALYQGNTEEARHIVNRIMAEAAPAALQASREGGPNWVVEALKPLDNLFLPDDGS